MDVEKEILPSEAEWGRQGALIRLLEKGVISVEEWEKAANNPYYSIDMKPAGKGESPVKISNLIYQSEDASE